MKDIDDDAGAIEDLRAGRAFEVTRLARSNLVIHDHDRRLGGRNRGRAVDPFVRLPIGIAASDRSPLCARLRLHVGRTRGDDALAPRECSELSELAVAKHRGRGKRIASLRDRRRDLEAKCARKAIELRDVRCVLDVGDTRKLDGDQNRERVFLARGAGAARGCGPRGHELESS
jgi:hypothetical protein